MKRRITARLLLLLAAFLWAGSTPAASEPWLRSNSGLVLHQLSSEVIHAKDADVQRPIASITKLMTAMVVLDSQEPLGERITITKADRDRHKVTRSRLAYGTRLTRKDLIHLALMSSENRAAHALARSHPGGKTAFVAAMNRKAELLGLRHTHFEDPAGLFKENVSTARELAIMVGAAFRYPLIRQMSTTWEKSVGVGKRRDPTKYRNTNRLIRNDAWNIGLSKTGYISESGRCLVMQAIIRNEPVIIVLLDSWGKLSPMGDANRIRKWLSKQDVAFSDSERGENAKPETETADSTS